MVYPRDFHDAPHPTGPKMPGDNGPSLGRAVSINLSSNFDVHASVEFEFDQALFTMALTEVETDSDRELETEESHLQSPLEFKQNNDHFRSVKRELVADDVESSSETKHALTIVNHQPDILHNINPDHA